MPQAASQSRGRSASAAAVPAQGLRETVSSHMSPGSILQPRVPARSPNAGGEDEPASGIVRPSTVERNARPRTGGIGPGALNASEPRKFRTACSRHPIPQCASDVQPCEGQRPATESGFFCCDRPGCEEHFPRPHLISTRRFCSPSCRQALRRVIERERRWQRRAHCRRHGRVADRSRGP